MDTNKIKEIFSDKSFVEELAGLQDNAAANTALKAKGLDLTEKEITAIRNLLSNINSGKLTAEEAESGELSDDMLDNVSGGFMFILGIITSIFGGDDSSNSTGATAHDSGATGTW